MPWQFKSKESSNKIVIMIHIWLIKIKCSWLLQPPTSKDASTFRPITYQGHGQCTQCSERWLVNVESAPDLSLFPGEFGAFAGQELVVNAVVISLRLVFVYLSYQDAVNSLAKNYSQGAFLQNGQSCVEGRKPGDPYSILTRYTIHYTRLIY